MRLHILDYDPGSNRYRTTSVFEKNGSDTLTPVPVRRPQKLWTPDDIAYVWTGKIINTREHVNGQVVDMLKQELLGVPEGADGILVYHTESGKIAASSMRRDSGAEDREVVATVVDIQQFLNQERVRKDSVLATGSSVVSCAYRFVRKNETRLFTPL